MDITQCVRDVAGKFSYKPDGLKYIDTWNVMSSKDGIYRGDCEDFTLTVFWLHANKNIWVFLWRLLITHQYGMYFCVSRNGERHAIGRYGDLWFDNWTRRAVPGDEFIARTGHKIYFRLISPIMVLPLLFGLIKKSYAQFK
jgi:hypothetical protein